MEDREAKRNKLLSFEPGCQILSKYRVCGTAGGGCEKLAEPIGRGGSGVVFVVDQNLHKAIVVKRAIKFYVFRDDIAALTAHRNTGPVSAVNFEDEIVNLASFNHENILKVIEAGFYPTAESGIPDGIPFLVTDYIDGPTLQKAIEDRRFSDAVRNEPHILIDLILQMCRGVCHLHAQNFYHCDIAPKNIFIRGTVNDPQLVIGDLGTGRTISAMTTSSDNELVFIAGSKDYCPPDVLKVLNTEVPLSQFQQFQPRWDLFAVAKTALQLVDSIDEERQLRPAWMGALRSTLVMAINGTRFESVSQLAERVRWLHPMQHTVWEVPELGENIPGIHRSLLPVQSVVTSPRVRDLTHHRALLRLKRVPQLVMASRIFHGGNHNRYEHTLGVYQATREYLLSLLRDDQFLSMFSPDYVQLALVTALLSNLTRFPFSTIIHELHAKKKELFVDFSRKSIFTELLGWNDKKVTLASVICQSFPHVDMQKLQHILAEGPLPHADPAVRFIRYLFNSSIDARVVDYVRRDSHHLGMYKGDAFELQNLLPHVRFRDGQMVVRSTGLSTVEEIITLRYWLFNRIYWNQPNRNMISMIKYVLWSLHDVPGFATKLRSSVLEGSEDSILMMLRDEAKAARLEKVEELCGFLLPERPTLYVELLQFNRSDGDANAMQLCDKFEGLGLDDEMRLQQLINTRLQETFKLSEDRQHVLLDLPVEYGPKKLGEDVNVETPRGEIVALNKVSGIVLGVQKGFTEHLQRLRVFVHPESHQLLETKREEAVRIAKEVLLGLL